MKPVRVLAAALAVGAGAILLLVPVRHHVVVESSATNPVRHLRIESRSLVGLRRPGWGVAVTGAPVWGNAREGFFLRAEQPVQAMVTAWPGFRQSLSMDASPAITLALSEEGDRQAFRTWFVALLEQQVEAPSPAWEPAQRDCAGLLRFAFREALATHTAAWRERVAFTSGAPAQDPSPGFVRDWRAGFPTPDGPQPFAKGAYLRRFACEFLGRDLQLAKPGDLIFFARGGAHAQPDHAMAFVRPDVDGAPMLLYHTGPEGSGVRTQPGEVRRARLDDLLHHPDPDFRPLPENAAFLGLYRWRLLVNGPSDLSSAPRS
ncbi:DUF1175 family protein [Geothrix sp. PMB-07]|uniref:DUF1175 family protein n=1 Tax=Geothrix sp. PMB-07 TaxID=3068640 RepID=UPI0027411280|nr:DUF1175 family protein [Geothrix sp. PMB-07]WLT30135.1 DUF1175 family protein [Geothrix sp. PMB-07]